MKYASLGSGSRGNCTVIVSPQTTILVDCGFGCRETENRLLKKGVDPATVAAIFVTHEHSDHRRGVGPFARKFGSCVYGTRGTLSRVDLERCKFYEIQCGRPVNVDDLTVHPVSVPHDAREPSQFVVEGAEVRLGILSDLGSLTHEVVEHYQYCDSLFVEANHDLNMLWNGPYQYSLKVRIASDLGHLSNEQTAEFVSRVHHSDMRHLVLGHLSQENNSPEIVSEFFDDFRRTMDVRIASQDEGTDWIDLA
ncbi:MAG: MBL fold metallo-hydrolase [Gammaproteobacteria bacterium]|nr:MBL fold metallo-hydrolase [Gammaproteobacteria bacterium]MYF38820.1 MBL fold metallo-hydrolase [Gammaproteobacteria bacterium]